MIPALAAALGTMLSRIWGILATVAAVAIAVATIAARARRGGIADTLHDIERASRDRTIDHHDLRSRIEADRRRAGPVPRDERLRSRWVAPR